MTSETATAPMTTAERLGGLLTKLELERTQKLDLIVPSSSLTYNAGRLYVRQEQLPLQKIGEIPNAGNDVNEVCHAQIAEKLSIPMAYYRRMMKEFPALLAENINGWLDKSTAKYLLRTFRLDAEQPGIARAFLSDRYGMLDNYDVLLAALDAIKEMGVKVEIKKAEVTDRRMYLHVVCPEIEINAEAFLREYMKNDDNAAAGNGIFSGFVLCNSEVGHGSFEIRPRAMIIKCMNGLVGSDDRFRRLHLGTKMEEGEVAWSDRTKQKSYELVISQTQDAIRTYLSPEYLSGMIQKVADANKIKLEHPLDTVENVCRELSITEEHKKGILGFFLADGDHHASGVFHAITRQAQEMRQDDQFDVEAGIGKLLPTIQKFDRPFSKN